MFESTKKQINVFITQKSVFKVLVCKFYKKNFTHKGVF